jgi:hypothetical protein
MTTKTETREKETIAPAVADQKLPAAVAPQAGLPAATSLVDYSAEEGLGAEGMTKDDFKIPLLRCLQSNSPQVDGTQALEGAKAGMLFNTATNEFWDIEKTPIPFIPVYRDENYVEYIPREPYGGGFVGIRAVDDPLVMKLRKEQGRFGKLKNAEGTELNGQHVPTEIVQTYYIFGLFLTPDGMVQRDVLPFTSTQIPKYTNFATVYTNTRYPSTDNKRLVLPPLWAHRYKLSTRPEQNKKGKYRGWVIGFEKPGPSINSRINGADGHKEFDPLYATARAFYDMIKEGQVKIDREADVKAGQADTAAADEELPF